MMQNFNKYLMSLVVALCLIPGLSFAQYCGEYNKDYKHHAKRHLKELNLTKDQKYQIKNIYQERKQNNFALRKKYWDKLPDTERQAFSKELEQNRANTNQQVRKILTKEQQVKFDESQKQIKQNSQEWDEFQKWKANKK